RVRKYAADELALRALQRLGDDEPLNQLRRLRADDVGAEQLARRLVEDRLHQPLRLAEPDRLAVRLIGKAADADGTAIGAGRRLGQADAGDLRSAVGTAGDVRDDERAHALDAGEMFDADHPLVHGLVRQPRRTDDIA